MTAEIVGLRRHQAQIKGGAEGDLCQVSVPGSAFTYVESYRMKVCVTTKRCILDIFNASSQNPNPDPETMMANSAPYDQRRCDQTSELM